MNKVSYFIIFAIIIITGCVLYLASSGISLRSAPLIQPSIISDDRKNISESLTHRLFQEFQTSDYIIWGISSSDTPHRQILLETKNNFKKIFKNRSVTLIENADKSSVSDIRACEKPCWLILETNSSQLLSEASFVKSNDWLQSYNFITLTIANFKRDDTVSAECENQKRLSYKCLVSTATRDIKRKLKNSDYKYFFLRKYNEIDYFLFME